MKRAALYCRVSKAQGQDVAMQVHELTEFAARRDFEVVETYSENGSGAKRDRKEFQRMMDDARKKKFDVVLCYRFDRIARSLAQLVQTLDELRQIGTDFISLHENVDTSTSQGRLMFGIFASIAEFERELIRERIISGLEEARRKGKKIGRRHMHLDRLDEVTELRKTMSLTEISEKTGIPRASVARLLKVRK